ncbi:MAG: VanZ family protein [Deltaproteobacteria bacterium]
MPGVAESTGRRDLVCRWGPVAAWAATIWLFSTEYFTGDGTSRVLVPLLEFFLPRAAPELLSQLHGLLRKLAHVTEFALLALLLGRALMRSHRTLAWLAWRVLPMAVAWAILDEWHQTFVPRRVGAVTDVLLDSAGVLLGFAVFAAWRARFNSGRRSRV